MTRRNYPLGALRAFEAAGRYLSFVKAADELHVTPAAISHQVKGLEDFLGVRLFRRLPRGLMLTDEAQRFLPDLREGFLRLDRAVDRVRETEAVGPLTISAAPIFAAKWLLPRLERFRIQRPEIDLRISANLALVDFQRDAIDLAIRLGRGKYEGLECVKLFDEHMTPMFSPRLMEGDHPIKTPQDLRHHVLLHDDSPTFDPATPNWTTWLEAAEATKVDAKMGPRFSHPDHSLQAAIDGAGVILGWRNLGAADVAAGRLIIPFDLALPLGVAFHLVYPMSHANRPKVVVFREWLLAEVGKADSRSANLATSLI